MQNTLKHIALWFDNLQSNEFKRKLLFTIVSVFYFIHNHAFLLNSPTGLHFIRQTDSISFSLYYLHNNDFNFFNIGNLNLDFDGGHTACEFPLFYYFYFLIFKFFGIHFWVLRLASLLIFVVALYKLINATYLVTQRSILSILIVYIVISSSVLRYYSVNFLPDSLALSHTLIGLSYFINYSFNKSKKFFVLALIFLSLGALLKIYYGIYLFLSAAFILIQNRKVNLKLLLPFIGCIILVLSWYLFAILYNKHFHSTYYLTTLRPIWNLSANEIKTIYQSIFNYWYTKLYLPTIFHFFGILIVLLILPKIVSIKIKIFLGLVVLTSIAYVLLFFEQFNDHDYYFITLIPAFYLIATLVINSLLNHFKNKIFEGIVILLMCIIVISGFIYTTLNINRRFKNNIDLYSIVNYQLRGADIYLKNIGVKNNDTFLVIGDNTVNGSLVLLNKFGWVYRNYENYVDKIELYIEKANYLIVLQPSKHNFPEHIKNKLKTAIKYNYKNNFIYFLK